MEEAIEEELWQAVMNAVAGEEHLLETALREVDALDSVDNKEEIMESIAKHLKELEMMRSMRKKMVNSIIEMRQGETPEMGKDMRNNTGELWCFSKHCLLIKMHLFETAQKYLNLASKDSKNRDKWMSKATDCVRLARNIHYMFIDTIETIFPQKISQS